MTNNDKKIYVTQPILPPLEKFVDSLKEIWKSQWLTNNGQFHQDFERALAEFLGVKYCSLFANGTLALIIGLEAFKITGEVITTPYSFVATVHALHWNKIIPVFCDIEEKTLNIDPDKIEPLITPNTTAILPVHVYGNPCNIEKITKIADKYGLRVIYDAAHAFGVKINETSILNFGDLSILSFHATKVFNTIEGGAIVTNDLEMKNKIDYLKNFGFADEVTVVGTGINAKMNEVQAAFGLLELEIVEKEIYNRKQIAHLYRQRLTGIRGITYLTNKENVVHNYSYFPVFINQSQFGVSRDQLYDELRKNDIYPRRYFYPLISHFPPYHNLTSSNPARLPVAEKKAEQVLCLPIYGALEKRYVNKICDIIVSMGT